MVAIERVRVAFTGFPGGPGVSTFYASNAGAMTGALWNMYDNLKTRMPANVAIQVETAGDTIDADTGALTGSWSIAPLVQLFGTQPGAYSAPSGAALTWLTNTVLNGSRVRGRTFVVPLWGGRVRHQRHPGSHIARVPPDGRSELPDLDG